MNVPIMPRGFLFILLVLTIFCHGMTPLMQLINFPWSFLGLPLIFLGAIINLCTDRLFREEGTTVNPYERPSKLISAGPFQYSRHPMYLGMFLILLGVGILLGSAIALFPSFLFLLLMEVLFIPEEEKNLEKVFGQDYLDYKKKVRRWF